MGVQSKTLGRHMLVFIAYNSQMILVWLWCPGAWLQMIGSYTRVTDCTEKSAEKSSAD